VRPGQRVREDRVEARTAASLSTWMMMAAWWLRFSQSVRLGSTGASEYPWIQRPGGAERVPLTALPNLAADTMWRASSTVETCGTMMEAPASRA